MKSCIVRYLAAGLSHAVTALKKNEHQKWCDVTKTFQKHGVKVTEWVLKYPVDVLKVSNVAL